MPEPKEVRELKEGLDKTLLNLSSASIGVLKRLKEALDNLNRSLYQLNEQLNKNRRAAQFNIGSGKKSSKNGKKVPRAHK